MAYDWLTTFSKSNVPNSRARPALGRPSSALNWPAPAWDGTLQWRQTAQFLATVVRPILFSEKISPEIQHSRLTGVSRLHGGRVGGSGSCNCVGGICLFQR